MPVRGPWCGRVYAWVIKYDEKGGERRRRSLLLGFLNVRHAARLMRLPVVAVAIEIMSSWLSVLNAKKFNKVYS